MTPEEEEKLKEEYRQAAFEDHKNSLTAKCEVRLVLDQTPHSGLRVVGAWVQCWRFIEGDNWLGDIDPEVSYSETPEIPASMAPEEWLAQEALAARWKVSKQTIRRLRKMGKLPFLEVTPAVFRIRMIDLLRIESEGKLLPATLPRRKTKRHS